MSESATILIPDISGYTEFLTKTELVHSSHIINELLEAILAANSGEFVLSEVEGDALLLYHKGKPIEADALVRQCLHMFESFHTQLKIIEARQLANLGGFLGKMHTTREGDATLLDRTSVLCGSAMGNASSHNCKNLPILLAGGGFHHAGHVAFDRKNNQPLSNLFVRMLHQIGIEADRFGSSTGTLGVV